MVLLLIIYRRNLKTQEDLQITTKDEAELTDYHQNRCHNLEKQIFFLKELYSELWKILSKYFPKETQQRIKK